MDSARKAYSMYGANPKRVYDGRRGTIRRQLPAMPGNELQRRINDLNEEITSLKEENERLQGFITEIKREGSVDAYLDGMHRTLTKSNVGILELRVHGNKQALKWMQREKRVWLWEIRLRKTAAVKLPFMRHQRASLNKKAHQLLCEMRSLSLELAKLREDYQKTCSEHYGLGRELEKLNSDREEPAADRVWTGFPIPSEAIQKLNKSLEAVDLREQKKRLHRLLRIRSK